MKGAFSSGIKGMCMPNSFRSWQSIQDERAEAQVLWCNLFVVFARRIGRKSAGPSHGIAPDALSLDMEAAELSDSAEEAFCADVTKSSNLLSSSWTAAYRLLMAASSAHNSPH